MPTFFGTFLLALLLFVQLPAAVKTTMNSAVAAPIIAEATSRPGSPFTVFGRLGQSLVRRLPVVRWLRASPRRWHRIMAPLRARQALHSRALSAFPKAPEPGPAGRGYPQRTALWVRGAGWGVTLHWSGAAGSRQRLRVEKRSQDRRHLSWPRA